MTCDQYYDVPLTQGFDCVALERDSKLRRLPVSQTIARGVTYETALRIKWEKSINENSATQPPLPDFEMRLGASVKPLDRKTNE